MNTSIRFENGKLNELRSNLLKDLSKEYYAILFGKYNKIDKDNCIISVKDIVYYKQPYEGQTLVSINIDGSFRDYCLNQIDERLDVDTIIDVHTHPFSGGMPHFSSVDTMDEVGMKRYIARNTKDGKKRIHYASIVFSQDQYDARLWRIKNGKVVSSKAYLKTIKVSEGIPTEGANKSLISNESTQMDMFNRSFLALGFRNMSLMMGDQVISIVGVGGVGSIVAEHLIHMGFQNINLIDFDQVELSNLNRLVGATYEDAVEHRLKVDVVKRHLESLNPFANIKAYNQTVYSPEMEKVLAMSDWVFMTTDNYKSCVHIQELAFRYYVPFISAATNIDTKDGVIQDVRGEVILVRPGDGFCLDCIGRINKRELMYERETDPEIRESLVQKGYVRGADVKDPAVKTLNTMVATIATDVLINQYTERQKDQYVTVFLNNEGPVIYEDEDALKHRHLRCPVCGQ